MPPIERTSTEAYPFNVRRPRNSLLSNDKLWQTFFWCPHGVGIDMSQQRPTEMLILAGGQGTRLHSVVSDVPKPMAPVSGRPFLEYVLDYWIYKGIRRFVISTGYLGDIVREHFGIQYGSAEIEYVHERSPLGTGGALRLALSSTNWRERIALVINGDTWFAVDLDQMLVDAALQRKPITLALKPLRENDRYGGVQLHRDGSVRMFGIQNSANRLVSAGCYLLDTDLIRRALSDYPDAFSLENDFLAWYADKGLVGASVQDRPFLDIGIPGDYERAAQFVV